MRNQTERVTAARRTRFGPHSAPRDQICSTLSDGSCGARDLVAATGLTILTPGPGRGAEDLVDIVVGRGGRRVRVAGRRAREETLDVGGRRVTVAGGRRGSLGH